KTRQAPMQIPFFEFFGFPENGGGGEYKSQSMGSGVIVRRDGKKYYVITNNHVIKGANEISVKLNDERRFPGSVVGADERKDVALISFESDDDTIPLAVLGDSDTVMTGDICFAMGTPLGYFSSVTQGIVSATGRSGSGIGNISDFIQTDAAINQGNSGGPLLNIYGEVIGINTWIASQSGGSQGLGFAIPINNIKRSIDQFISGGKAVYGWVGVSLVEMNDKSYLKDLGAEDKPGALVSQVFLGAPADKGGLLPGDYVIALNGKNIQDVDQLVRDVGNLDAKETAIFRVLRNKKEVEVKITVAERNEEEVNDSSKLWPGFIAYPINEDVRKALSLKESVKGILVDSLQPKTPGVTMGLRKNDVIIAVNDKPVADLGSLYTELNDAKKQILFDVYRDGHVVSTVKYHR
ncbi:MAG: Do family serine endopeptidase, partial [Spirochaetaceae bacterium]|nr:Do family serine endopeptidase [Spirochaetaceae bacterium]